MRRELLAVVGLTCTGKGELALAVADEVGGPDAASFVVCDSAKVYRGADVGTAKVPASARRGYEFFMVDVADPGESYSAGRYMREGRAACEDLWRRGKTPIVVGGTGLYFRALIDGIVGAPPADEGVRASLAARRARGVDLHSYLSAVDADAAARISPADDKRIVRALEVFELSGIPLSKLQKPRNRPLAADRVTVVALAGSRPWLAERVAKRTRRMVAAGLRDETAKLLKLVGDPAAPPLNAIGYRQMVQLLAGEWDEAGAIERIARETLRLAKKQRTWFKREPRAAWVDAEKGIERLREEVLAIWRP
ncbi:MAG TPA: tRNA (adenosine(37)-N6)-dimethylallyltransferase MiaA [bacterium]|nr:tRNA (adenosine(37)-N6)-dimethylallyltransferase MiaA [bacterium]